jgi:hypothetical protein
MKLRTITKPRSCEKKPEDTELQRPPSIPCQAVFGNFAQTGVLFTVLERSRCLTVVHVEREAGTIRIISARLATAEERTFYEYE